MDVTPSDKMFEAMKTFNDAVNGEEPSLLDASRGAIARRSKRKLTMDFLHYMVGLSMREGVNRAIKEAKLRQSGLIDGADRSAISQAIEDAHKAHEAGGDKAPVIQMPRR